MDRFGRFDAAYYQRFYEDPSTRVYDEAGHSALASFILGFTSWNHLPVESVLDIGAGVGHWHRWLTAHHPEIRYTGTEVSKAMCQRFGWQERDIARWRDRKKYDLILCQGVLQYLPDPDVAPAVANIAAMAKGLVYFEITTRADLREHCDLERTDTDIHVRNGSYYRGILLKHLLNVGAGLWWPKDRPAPFYELEVGQGSS